MQYNDAVTVSSFIATNAIDIYCSPSSAPHATHSPTGIRKKFLLLSRFGCRFFSVAAGNRKANDDAPRHDHECELVPVGVSVGVDAARRVLPQYFLFVDQFWGGREERQGLAEFEKRRTDPEKRRDQRTQAGGSSRSQVPGRQCGDPEDRQFFAFFGWNLGRETCVTYIVYVFLHATARGRSQIFAHVLAIAFRSRKYGGAQGCLSDVSTTLDDDPRRYPYPYAYRRRHTMEWRMGMGMGIRVSPPSMQSIRHTLDILIRRVCV